MYKLSKKYPQKRAFITGAASGLGKALCLELARDGWTIGISDINEPGLKQSQAAIESAGGKAISYLLDVSDRSEYREVSGDFLSKTNGIDLLINNAGVGDGCLFEDYSLENWDWMIDINLKGVIFGCHYFIPTMKAQGNGHIINVSSIASISNSPRMSGYNVTKAGVKALSETLYGELKEFNVSVSVMLPFFFRTNIMQYSRGDDESKEMGTLMVGGSKVSASEVAVKALKKAGNRKFYILEPIQAGILFHLQRLFPRKFLDLSSLMVSKREKIISRARKQYEKNLQEGKIKSAS